METDYLVIGAGTTGLCFTDELLRQNPEATVTIVDRRAQPGGHWVDAYPFVELHQPSSFYGLPTRKLGDGKFATTGANKGLETLATGTEILHHFERHMAEEFLTSGRVTFLPLHEVTEEGRIRSLLSGEEREVDVRRKTVNAAYHQNSVPRTHRRAYSVAPELVCIPPNELPARAPEHRQFTVIGAGKTGIDAVLYLLRMGAKPAQITWIMPRDSWLWDRETTQNNQAFFGKTMGGFAGQLEAAAAAKTPQDFALMMEEKGIWFRVYDDVTPSMFHAATCSREERRILREVTNIVRMGRVREITPGKIKLDGGEAQVPEHSLFIDCTASAIDKKPTRPIFEDDLITCQILRFPSISLSAAILGWLEVHGGSTAEKNRFASPCPLPDTVEDYMTTLLVGLINQGQWRQFPELDAYLTASRLDMGSSLIAGGDNKAPERAEILMRVQSSVMPAFANLQRLASA
ncbi:NAD(P)-binding protein [Parvularcula sp. ZS-1/3]|uniref:NAD(P)-binding protein n=1 Tax=Parvularcula mediterranea TaxID=2732508 RepID=A0A7Y3W449_9PROT|nr:NAD(P)-binding protein [Parvularcula mediterranea]NNU14887.1 NAD(P)-binding protein [Parvularcula mediterranea]